MKTNFRFAAFIACITFSNFSFAQSWKLTGNNLDSTGMLGSTNNFDVKFITKGISRMAIKKNGYIGIGTNSPAVALHLFGAMQIENNNTINYDDPLLTLRSSAANGTVTNPVIAFKGEDTLYAIMGYDFSTRDIVISAQPGLYAPNVIVNHNNGFMGLNTKTPAYQLDVNGTSRFSGNVGIQTVPTTRTLQVGILQGSLLGIGSSEYIQDAGASFLSTNSSWLPVTDNLYSLGNTSFRWKDVWAVDGTINTSDARDKTNIRDLNYGLKEIMQLRAIKFNWKNNADEGDKLGVIAQEIQKILPEVVRDWDYNVNEQTGRKTKTPAQRLGVMYADIIPVLIKGMQEQQKEIEDLKLIVGQLTSSQNTNTVNINKTEFASATSLAQNLPNPVKNSTVIGYNIGNSKNAQLHITDANGKTINQIQLNQGTGYANVDCTTLSAGTYYYTLIIDGKTTGRKKMMVTK